MELHVVQLWVLRLVIAAALLWVTRRELARMAGLVLRPGDRNPDKPLNRLDMARAWLLVVITLALVVLVVLALASPTLPAWVFEALGAVVLGGLCVGVLLSVVIGFTEGWRSGDTGPARRR